MDSFMYQGILTSPLMKTLLEGKVSVPDKLSKFQSLNQMRDAQFQDMMIESMKLKCLPTSEMSPECQRLLNPTALFLVHR